MFKTPDGREVAIQSREALALLFVVQGDEARYRVDGFIECFMSNESKAVTEYLRGKSKADGEDVAPLVADIVRLGKSTVETAKVRHSEAKALWYGWQHGRHNEISAARGWQEAVDVSRAKRNADKAQAEIAARKDGIKAMAVDLVMAAAPGTDVADVQAQAEAEYDASNETAKHDAAVARLEKQALALGYRLVKIEQDAPVAVDAMESEAIAA